MAVANNCELPEDLYYLVEKHVWARPVDGLVTVGITDVAQSLAKTLVAVTPREVGRRAAKGRSLATVESGKWVGPVPSPVAGEVVEVNHAVVQTPSTINRDPYGEGWILRLRPEDWQRDAADLVTGPEGIEAYQRFLDAQGITCAGPEG